MKAHENKKFMQHIFAELERGNSGPFIDAMAEDFSWTITGSTTWSRKYEGKKAVLDELFNALRAVLAPPIITVGERFIADETTWWSKRGVEIRPRMAKLITTRIASSSASLEVN